VHHITQVSAVVSSATGAFHCGGQHGRVATRKTDTANAKRNLEI